MNTHEDSDFRREWIESLDEKASRMKATEKSTITGGARGEAALAEWKANGVGVRHMPPDEHGILRISIGGGDTPLPLNYCVFRGDHSACVDLLRQTLTALEAAGE